MNTAILNYAKVVHISITEMLHNGVCVYRLQSIWLVMTCWLNLSLGLNHGGTLQNNLGHHTWVDFSIKLYSFFMLQYIQIWCKRFSN